MHKKEERSRKQRADSRYSCGLKSIIHSWYRVSFMFADINIILFDISYSHLRFAIIVISICKRNNILPPLLSPLGFYACDPPDDRLTRFLYVCYPNGSYDYKNSNYHENWIITAVGGNVSQIPWKWIHCEEKYHGESWIITTLCEVLGIYHASILLRDTKKSSFPGKSTPTDHKRRGFTLLFLLMKKHRIRKWWNPCIDFWEIRRRERKGGKGR